MSEPLTPDQLDEIRDRITAAETIGETTVTRAARTLLNEVDGVRSALTAQAEEDAEIETDLQLQVDGWQTTARELTEALRRHVIDWGHCRVGPGGCDCSHARAVMLLIREGALDGQDETEGVVAQQDSAPETSGTGAGSNPAHPHPAIAALRKQAAAQGAQAIPALLAAIDQLADERDEAVTAHDLDRVHWLADNGQLWAERARLREVHTGIRRLITAWETRPGTFDTPSAATVLRDMLGGDDVAFADEPAELTADHTLRTAAGQETSDE